MPARGRKPTAAMPAPVVQHTQEYALLQQVARPGWLCGSRKTAWKGFEPCEADAPWAQEAGAGTFRRKVVKVECAHKRAGRPSRAVVAADDDRLEEVYRFALIYPCQYTHCPRWAARHESR
jgi:hypothetical protein